MNLQIEFKEEKPDPLEGVYYLASPFSHEDKRVEYLRYCDVIGVACLLNKQDYVLIEPINMGFTKALHHKLPTDNKFWQNINSSLMNISHGIIVVKLDGWKQSKGVSCEIDYANEINLPIYYLDVERKIK